MMNTKDIKKEKLKINNIPAVVWGEKSGGVFIAIHGNMSHKEDEVIKILASEVSDKGFQVLSFDLPQHGERKQDNRYLCKVQNCVKDLNEIIEYAKTIYKEINIFACSMGAYFALLSYKNEEIKKCFFLSPVVNMKYIIDNMMHFGGITEKDLEEKQIIETSFGQTLYWDYYSYVKDNPVEIWDKETHILYGDKDDMQNENIIKDFSERFNCGLSVLHNGEHYFHTKEQLDYYKQWINSLLRKH